MLRMIYFSKCQHCTWIWDWWQNTSYCYRLCLPSTCRESLSIQHGDNFLAHIRSKSDESSTRDTILCFKSKSPPAACFVIPETPEPDFLTGWTQLSVNLPCLQALPSVSVFLDVSPMTCLLWLDMPPFPCRLPHFLQPRTRATVGRALHESESEVLRNS